MTSCETSPSCFVIIACFLLCNLVSVQGSREDYCSVYQQNSTHLTMACNRDNDSSKNSNICGACDHAVSWSERGVACEECGKWYHASCQSIGSKSYQNLHNTEELWHCDLCGNHNYSTTMFDLHGVGHEENHTNSRLNNSDIGSVNSDFMPYHSSTPSKRSRENKFQSRPLRLLNVNFQSITSKKAETLELLDRIKPDIIIGTETWLKSDIKDSELLTHKYKIYRKDRKNGNRGGVLIAVKDDLQSTRVDTLDCDCECIWVKVLTKTLKPVYIGGFYRPDVKDTKALTTFQKSMMKAAEIKNAQLIIAGDFNLPSWDWTNKVFKENGTYRQSHEDFIEVLNDLDLEQMVLEPTREKNILDIVLTNSPDLIPRLEVIPGLSDHDIVFFEFSVKLDRKKNALRQIMLYKRADWQAIKEEMNKLETEIGLMLENDSIDIDEIWEKFKKKTHCLRV